MTEFQKFPGISGGLDRKYRNDIPVSIFSKHYEYSGTTLQYESESVVEGICGNSWQNFQSEVKAVVHFLSYFLQFVRLIIEILYSLWHIV